MKSNSLQKALGPWLLTFYGLGTIIGAGIYVLIGEVAAQASLWMPVSFLLAGFVAGLTALSYADLATRLPQSAGEAAYVQEAWSRKWLSRLVGLGIVLTGIVSAATISRGFAGYLSVFLPVSSTLSISSLVVLLTLVAAWGMRSSAVLVFGITLIEAGGLCYCMILAFGSGEFTFPLPSSLPSWSDTQGLILGSILAFYAFIGFEDMVNVIEEVERPRQVFPRAVVIALVSSILLYILLGIAALGTAGADVLASGDAPMVNLIEHLGGNPLIITIISLLAVVNGALVQIIMGSRVMYGMSCQKLLPGLFGLVYSRTHTPVLATAVVGILVMVFALKFPIAVLARITSVIMLAVFTMVNLALLVLKHRQPASTFSVPLWIPAFGALTACALVFFQIGTFLF